MRTARRQRRRTIAAVVITTVVALSATLTVQFANAGENGSGRRAGQSQGCPRPATHRSSCQPAPGRSAGSAAPTESSAPADDGAAATPDPQPAADTLATTLKADCRAFARAQFAANGGAPLPGADANSVAGLEISFLNACVAVAQGAAAAGGVDINNPPTS